MDIVAIIQGNATLGEKVYRVCEIELLKELRPPENLDGNTTFNMKGQVFGCDGTGGEFILLEDGTIGFSGSEGETGRIAEDMEGLFTLLLNCPCFYDFTEESLYGNDVKLTQYTTQMEQSYRADFNELSKQYGWGYEWDGAKQDIAIALNLPLYKEIEIAQKVIKPFYMTATRSPRFQSIYRSDDGEDIITDCVIC